MSKLTPLGNLPYPQPTDVADVPLHLQSLAEAIDGRTVLRFTDIANLQARVTNPVAGMVAWLGTPGRLFHYAGNHWAPVAPGPVHKVNNNEGSTTSTTFVETLTNAAGDPMAVSFTAPPSGSVIVTVGAYTYNSAADGLAYMSAAVRLGTTVKLAAHEDRSSIVRSAARASASTQFQVSGLTGGALHTVTPAYRAGGGAGNTASFDNRFVRVDPVT
ncbi:hypothetical protein ABT112_11135 [Streptomyces sp. NPDC002055]|uniref:hypothetical protein n=1 Tax=Streptomyces sp. NPDC002055 TaxID=3154534 RepID=UPI00331E80C3